MQEENSKMVNKLEKYLPKKGKSRTISVYAQPKHNEMIDALKKKHNIKISDSHLLLSCLEKTYNDEIISEE